MKSLKKYYTGLLVIGVIILGMTIFVISQSGKSRDDEKTYKYASEIVDKVNTYMTSATAIPSSFYEMGIKDVQPTVRYQKVSDEEYKFCVTYKTQSGLVDLSMTNLAFSLIPGSYSGYSDPSYVSSYLYLDIAHKKGENCINIKPLISAGFNQVVPATGTDAASSI